MLVCLFSFSQNGERGSCADEHVNYRAAEVFLKNAELFFGCCFFFILRKGKVAGYRLVKLCVSGFDWEGLNVRTSPMKRLEQREHLVSVVHHHSYVCSMAHWSHRVELFYKPESKTNISNIYGQFIIDVPIWSPSSPWGKPSEQTRNSVSLLH